MDCKTILKIVAVTGILIADCFLWLCFCRLDEMNERDKIMQVEIDKTNQSVRSIMETTEKE